MDMLALFVLILCLYSSAYSVPLQGKGRGWALQDQGALRARGAMSYVVSRGCPFLAHYVRDNYYDYVPVRRQASVAMTTTASPHINWVAYLHDTLVADYVPLELFKGLMNCGKEYAMFAIDASNNLTQTLHVDYHSVPGLVGK